MKKYRILLVLVLGVLAYLYFKGPDLTFKPAGPEYLDFEPRFEHFIKYSSPDGMSGLPKDNTHIRRWKHHGQREFEEQGVISTSGRVYHTTVDENRRHGIEKRIMVVLVLGPGATEQDFIRKCSIRWSRYGYRTHWLPEGFSAVQLIILNPSEKILGLRPGDYLSVKGPYGESSYPGGAITSNHREFRFLVEPVEIEVLPSPIPFKRYPSPEKPIGVYFLFEHFILDELQHPRFKNGFLKLYADDQNFSKIEREKQYHPITQHFATKAEEHILTARLNLLHAMKSFEEPTERLSGYVKVGESIKIEQGTKMKPSYLDVTLSGNTRISNGDFPYLLLEAKGKYMLHGSGSSINGHLRDNDTAIVSWSRNHFTVRSVYFDYGETNPDNIH